MCDIKVIVKNEQIRQTHKQKLTDTDNSMVATGRNGRGGRYKVKGQVHGEGEKLGFVWRAHSAMQVWCTTEMHT